ncbi:MAG: hypothetical protein LBS73_05450 [Campylobacteraceae bacterium]|jgi:alpha-tubulin suppressor-like RCC1 family protein|nr:hypothetical protein [Campylobacteraceae bacterium]
MSLAWFKTKVLSFFGLSLLLFILVGCGSSGGGGSSDTNASKGNESTPSDSKELTGFTFDKGVLENATFNGTNVDITIYYRSANNLKPTVTHTGARYSPNGTTINFGEMPKTYTITAEDNTSKSYNVTIRRAFVVSNEGGLADAIDIINGVIANKDNISYITILVENDISLTGEKQRNLTSGWVGRNIILEKYNTNASSVIISGLALSSDNVVGRSNVKIAKPATAISADGYHSLVLDSEGKIWASGSNSNGQLGFGDYADRTSFKPVTISGLASGVKIANISANGDHSLVLDSNGKIWGAGYNKWGQLSLGNNVSQTSFQPAIGSITSSRIVSISAGGWHSLALDSSGKIWAAGANWNGCLGLGDNADRNLFQPVTIKGLASGVSIVSISAGGRHSLALDSSGKVWAAGYNEQGQLGLGNNSDLYSFQPVILGSIANATIVSISAGHNHSLALDSEDQIWAAGENVDGQLGLSTTDNQNKFQLVSISGVKIVAISAGRQHSLAYDKSGNIWASGSNSNGQLSVGNNIAKQSVFSSAGSNATSIAAGYDYSLTLTSDGKIWASGANDSGQLGLGDTTKHYKFTYAPLLF